MQIPASRLPGILVVAVLGLLSVLLTRISILQQLGLGALTLAIGIGMLAAGLAPRLQHHRLQPGILLCKGPLLRWGIILYGLHISLDELQALGSVALLSNLVMLLSTFALCYLAGTRLLRLDPLTSALIGAGSSICGAAAAVATGNSLQASDRHLASAIATVVLFGSLSMLLYPVLYQLDVWSLADRRFALYIGSTVHEVAQVVAAGDSLGSAIAQDAVSSKMLRVLLLAPFLLLLPWCLPGLRVAGSRSRPGVAGSIPWFAFGFLAVIVAHSLLPVPQLLLDSLQTLGNGMLTMAMLALGLSLTPASFRAAGLKPFLLGALAWAWLVVGGGALQWLLCHCRLF